MTSNKKIREVWEKAKPIQGQNPDVFRKDKFGNKIKFGSYGTLGEYGWEIDHKNPKNNDGSDKNQNLQPLHWEENREKSDEYPYKK